MKSKCLANTAPYSTELGRVGILLYFWMTWQRLELLRDCNSAKEVQDQIRRLMRDISRVYYPPFAFVTTVHVVPSYLEADDAFEKDSKFQSPDQELRTRKIERFRWSLRAMVQWRLTSVIWVRKTSFLVRKPASARLVQWMKHNEAHSPWVSS